MSERLGRASCARPAGPLAWVHAASVGETSSILPLLERLGAMNPALTMLLTTGTVTSARFAAARLGERTIHQYIPLDERSFVDAFLDHWQPAVAIFTEQEIWPNLVLAAADREIPLALVNARMSDRSFERWRRRSGLAAALFSRFAVVLAQNEMLAARFRELGAPRAVAVGNLKIDAPPPPVDAGAFRALEAALAGRPRVLAASTHDDEELALVEAYRHLRTTVPGLVLIVAPRHPERGAAIADALMGLGLAVRRRSEGELPGPDTEVYIADTIGELGTLYALTPIAFVGGSLIPHGGQNPIEAVRHGAVVVTGPSQASFADSYRVLLDARGAICVETRAALGPALEALMRDHDAVAAMRARATAALGGLSGALERTVVALRPYLPELPAGAVGPRP